MPNGISPATPPATTYSPTDPAPLAARKKESEQIIGASFCFTAACITSLLPPQHKYLGIPAATILWTGAQNTSIKEFVPAEALNTETALLRNTATFSPFLLTFPAQAYLTHPTTRSGRILTQCMIGRYPVGWVVTRLAAQLGATWLGAEAGAYTDQKLGVKLKESGSPGGVNWQKIPESLFADPHKLLRNLGLFSLATLSAHPRIRSHMMKYLPGSPAWQTMQAECITTSALVGAAVLSSAKQQTSSPKPLA